MHVQLRLRSQALLLALVGAVLAVGSVHVVNDCKFDVYFAEVSQNVTAAMALLPPTGFSSRYSKPNNGISIKLSPRVDGKVTQFEYTWASPMINYDISNIDGNPFADYGMSIVPSREGASGYPSCKTVSCLAGQTICADAYNDPNDVRTMVCPDASDLTMTLCPGGTHPANVSRRETAFGSSGHVHHRHSRKTGHPGKVPCR